MKIFHSYQEFESEKQVIVTTGTFDGLHTGHIKILDKLIHISHEKGLPSVLMTFFPHPRMVLYPDDHGIKLINTIEERIELLSQTGIDFIIIQPFDLHFSKLSGLEYINTILVEKLRAHTIITGYDHRFGRSREGNISLLKEMGKIMNYQIHEIPAQQVNEISVSSTKIRKAVEAGQIEMANQLLGRPYFFSGRVVMGNQKGREIGYPTANIQVEAGYKLMPSDGVYAVWLHIEGVGKMKGMMNIGFRPTWSGRDKQIEVHIFNFSRDIYGKSIRVFIQNRLRDEQKFPDIGSLKSQLDKDKSRAIDLLD